MRVLVTGVGGDIGQSIVKVCRQLEVVESVIGADIYPSSIAEKICDQAVITVAARDDDFMDNLKEVVVRQKIDAIIFSTEAELRGLKKGVVSINGSKIVAANEIARRVGFDKLKTTKFLNARGIRVPDTRIASHRKTFSHCPSVIKPRFGAGSSRIYYARNKVELDRITTLHPNFIVQEDLRSRSDGFEYTCGVHGFIDGEVAVIVLRRRIAGGMTIHAEVVANRSVEKYCMAIAKALDLRGSINIQLFLTDDGPVLFEINPRFSSTVLLRHMVNFKDVEWSLMEQIQGKTVDHNRRGSFLLGQKFARSFNWQHLDC